MVEFDVLHGACHVEKQLFIHLSSDCLELHYFYNSNDGKVKLMDKDATDMHVWGIMTIYVYTCVDACTICLDIGWIYKYITKFVSHGVVSILTMPKRSEEPFRYEHMQS